jgi:tripartite-type tricarboxylate transporter receptor subunit TctC
VAPAAIVSVFLEIKPQVPAQSLAEFIAHARAHPGKLNYGSPGNGSSPHLAGEMFNKAAKVKTTHVPYKGAGPAMTDLLGGQLDFMFDPGIGLQHVKAGKLKLLAVGSPKRHPAYPDVPTAGEIVGEAFDADTVFGIFVPAGTPKDVVTRLNREISAALQSAELRSRISAIGAQELILGADGFAAAAARRARAYGAARARDGIARGVDRPCVGASSSD